MDHVISESSGELPSLEVSRLYSAELIVCAVRLAVEDMNEEHPTLAKGCSDVDLDDLVSLLTELEIDLSLPNLDAEEAQEDAQEDFINSLKAHPEENLACRLNFSNLLALRRSVPQAVDWFEEAVEGWISKCENCEHLVLVAWAKGDTRIGNDLRDKTDEKAKCMHMGYAGVGKSSPLVSMKSYRSSFPPV